MLSLMKPFPVRIKCLKDKTQLHEFGHLLRIANLFTELEIKRHYGEQHFPLNLICSHQYGDPSEYWL